MRLYPHPCTLFLFVLAVYYSIDLCTAEGHGLAVKEVGDTQAELLDKEYGVRYANSCEGQ